MIYSGFEIQSFEAGSGLWHARIQRADQKPVVIDGMPFPTLEVGFAWPDPDAAVADAKAHIDRLERGYATSRATRSSEPRNSPEAAGKRVPRNRLAPYRRLNLYRRP